MSDRDWTGRVGAGSGKRRKRLSGRRKALRIATWCAGGAFVLGGAGAGYAYFALDGNLKSVDINAALGTDRPENVDNGSMDILVLGSDSREGSNQEAGGGVDEGTARADTAMVVHINEGHKKASVVSIPRDTVIDRPSCTDLEGGTAEATNGVMFNSAYQTGGAACAVKTVESMSGIRMDHFMEVDFSGFEDLIDELGGVEITTTESINDPDSHLDLEAGTNTLSGAESLGLVRTRHGVGDGSDLGRIQVQQAFVKALLDQIKEVGVFSNPAKLYDLADTATKTLTTDSELASLTDLSSFAKSVKGIGSDDINMVTMPVEYDPADPNRVIPVQSKADKVWKALKADKAIPKSATKGNAGDATDAEGVVK